MTKTSERVDMWFLRRIYGLLLTLYPQEYQGEFGEELQMVFNSSLDDATKNGGSEVIVLVMRELVSLPVAIIYEHLRERRKLRMNKTFASRFDFAPGSWTESFAALAPFLFGMAMVFFGYLSKYITFPLWSQVTFVNLFWSLLLGLFLLGPAKGLPRWFLPYLGLPLPLISLLVFNSLIERLQGIWWYRLPWSLGAFIQAGLFWMGFVLPLLLLVVISRLVPKFRPFYQRLRDDWTLLSFIIYGAMPMVLFISYNEYKNEEPFMFLSLLSLAVGGWLYLRNDTPWKRFQSLFIGSALSMLVAAIGKAVLEESSFPGGSSTWQTEFMDTLVMWLWLALIMLIPVFFKLFSRPDDRPQAV